MNAEIMAEPLPVPEASRAQIEALSRVWMHQSGYVRLRNHMDIEATTRARAEWGMAVLEYVDATVAVAESKDHHRGPIWAAATARERMFTKATPENASCEQAWAEYQAVRRAGNADAIAEARAVWRVEFVGWFQAVASKGAIEDEQAFQELRGQIDDADRLGSGGPDEIPGSRKATLLQQARERERQEAIRRDQTRYESEMGWHPANR